MNKFDFLAGGWQHVYDCHFANEERGVVVTRPASGVVVRTKNVDGVTYSVLSNAYEDEDNRVISRLGCGDGGTSSGQYISVPRRELEDWLQAHRDKVVTPQDRHNAFLNVMKLIVDNQLEREVFMHLFRNSSTLSEQMTADDGKEVFRSVLLGADDIIFELFDEVCREYDVDIGQVIENAGGCEWF